MWHQTKNKFLIYGYWRRTPELRHRPSSKKNRAVGKRCKAGSRSVHTVLGSLGYATVIVDLALCDTYVFVQCGVVVVGRYRVVQRLIVRRKRRASQAYKQNIDMFLVYSLFYD